MATDIRLKETLPEVTEALVATYTECSRINHLGHKPLPSREAIVDILADLLDILYPGVEAVTIYRIAHELLLLGVPLIPRMMTEHAHAKTGIDIHPGARIGASFFIDHGTGVVIGETCDIGAHVKLYQGVTLGALSFPRDADGNIIRGMKRHPTLEDEVVVYANATILGGETVVGHHAVIGSNVCLTHSVDPDTVVSLEKPSLRIKGPDTRDLVPMYQI